MNTKVFNLALMFFWLVLCVGLLTRDWWMPPGLHARADGPQTPLVVAVAGILAAWNFMRFFIAHRFGKPAQPLPTTEAQRRKIRAITGEDPRVTDPQFNFDDPPPNGSPPEGRS
jgi:hypothetical protein